MAIRMRRMFAPAGLAAALLVAATASGAAPKSEQPPESRPRGGAWRPHRPNLGAALGKTPDAHAVACQAITLSDEGGPHLEISLDPDSPGHPDHLLFSANNQLLAVAHRRGGSLYGRGRSKIRVWSLATRRLVRTVSIDEGLISDLAFSPDGNRLIAIIYAWSKWQAPQSSVRSYDLATQATWRVDTAGDEYTDVFSHVSCSPDGRLLAVLGRRAVYILAAADGDEIARLPFSYASLAQWSPDGGPCSGARPHVSRDGRTAVAVKRGLSARAPRLHQFAVEIRDTAEGRLLRELDRLGDDGVAARLSDDGRYCAIAAGLSPIRIWRVDRYSGLREK